MAALSAGLARARDGAAAVLRAYAGLLFARSPLVGAMVLATTALHRDAALVGLAAVVTSLLVAPAFGIGREATREGPYGANALLVGLGVAHLFAPGLATTALAVAAAAASVVVAAALVALLARGPTLPVLSAPFLVVLPLAAAAGLHLGLPLAAPPGVPVEPPIAALAAPLEALGALLYLPRWDAGALLALALLVHSRIATLIAATALAASLGLLALVEAPIDPGTRTSVGLNALLAATALGGVWFVPSASSLALGTAGGLLASLLALGLAAPLGRLGVPVLIAPFWLAVCLVLLAARQRAADADPKSVDFAPGTPEENRRYWVTQRARFAALLAVPMRLPFRGAWTCTQGVDGEHTHQGPWRFAFDFEVRGEDGKLASGGGASPEQYHCHRLPVLAAADGTVVAASDALADNAVGAQDLVQNWGNHVVVQHAPGLCSLVAHLARGSVRVRVGQVVRAGDEVGLCGSSGRSPRPHLHFQLQGTPELGAPTLACRFTDVVRVEAAGERLGREVEPAEGDTLRSVEPDDDVARCLALAPGTSFACEVDGEVERLEVALDLLGRLVVRSSRGATLWCARTREGFVAFDVLGDAGSALHLVRAALARLPFDGRAGVTWSDVIPARWGRSAALRLLRDFVAPFSSREGVELDYTLTRSPGRVTVIGRSRSVSARGVPAVTTRAELSERDGLVALEVRRGERTVRAVRARSESAARGRPVAEVAGLAPQTSGER